jgi:peptidoglycan/LPS O-acetylase OafA/YrhL
MLTVGGAAALTAIVAYLAWHFFTRWRATRRLRRAETREKTGGGTASARDARELVSQR